MSSWSYHPSGKFGLKVVVAWMITGGHSIQTAQRATSAANFETERPSPTVVTRPYSDDSVPRDRRDHVLRSFERSTAMPVSTKTAGHSFNCSALACCNAHPGKHLTFTDDNFFT
ncbi:hypothetical protein MHU86_13848 [Fragilaria crotonensis]|nr:hypothetical protein MHU86_13848 [Fragilaria crotonensis]